MNKLTKNPDIQEVFKRLHQEGFQVYIVGGAVRDYLLGLDRGDVDFTTNATPEEIKSIFPNSIETGIRFGTVTVKVNNSSFEITTFREESGYSDKRHPDELRFSQNLLDDLKRRDLTVNGLVMTEDGQILDFVNGLEDIKNGIIRTIGNPEERFNEDQLRKWRAIRLASEKGFEFEPDTYNSISYDPYTNLVSIERIRDELNKIICSEKVNWGGYHLVRTRLYQLLLKRIGLESFIDRQEQIEDLVEPFEIMYLMKNDLASRLTLLLLTMTRKEAVNFLIEMKYPKSIAIKVLNYLKAINITKGATCKSKYY